ncbi:hypothetical protein DL768_002468 [Monosporascus sp. mg162]|nr:hypothetical protein DL768_002468 [Monosporascus sp. mg162]
MAAVLSTPELLEGIFLQCDIRSILTSAQRVCRQWHEIIVSSPAVQTHLYFRPGPPPLSSQGSTLNPLLSEVFAPFFAPFVINRSEGFWDRTEIESLPLARNPGPFMRADASWRSMHVQQPPLRALGVVTPSENVSLVHEGEVRMGELYDHVVRILTRPAQGWRILWGERRTLEDHRTLLEDFNADCTREILREVDVVLVRCPGPFRSTTVLPSDRDFMARFTHPTALKSRVLNVTPPKRIRGRMSRREQREL